MTYLREVTVCVFIASLIQSAYFFSLFVLVSLLSKPFILLSILYFAATCVFLTSYFNVGAGYRFYPLPFFSTK